MPVWYSPSRELDPPSARFPLTERGHGPPLFPWIESKIASIREFLSQNRYWFGNVSIAAWNNPFLGLPLTFNNDFKGDI